MKNLTQKLCTLFFIVLASPIFIASQVSTTEGPHFEVNKIYPPFSTTKEKLKDVHSIVDLNRFYKSSWIRSFVSVEVAATVKGQKKKVIGKNDQFTKAQKELMKKADLGTDLEVTVWYMPENTLSHNEVKDFNFVFTIEPEQEASFVGGEKSLNQYLSKQAIEKIPSGTFINYDLAAIKFTINEAGEINEAQIFESSKDEKVDALLLEAICNMPRWHPATYQKGHKVEQQFVLTVGNMENCMVNTLNIRKTIEARNE